MAPKAVSLGGKLVVSHDGSMGLVYLRPRPTINHRPFMKVNLDFPCLQLHLPKIQLFMKGRPMDALGKKKRGEL